jgi:hypothetical protein
MTQTHVVIFDPRDEYWEGALVNLETAHVLRSRRVVTLPVNPALINKSAVGGYYRRSWGSGWLLADSIPRMHCPIVLYASPSEVVGQGRLDFAARLVPDAPYVGRAREGMKFAGAIRITAESGQPYSHSGGFSPDHDTCYDIAKLPPIDEDGGWTIQGGAQLNVPGDGFFSAALYGAAAGLRVVWLAVSQSG